MYTDAIVILILMNVQCLQNVVLRPTLKSCWFPIHQLFEIKNSHEPPVDRNFFFAISLSDEIYAIKRFKKISS